MLYILLLGRKKLRRYKMQLVLLFDAELYESICKWNLHTFSHGKIPKESDLLKRHIVSFTFSDLKISKSLAFYNICFISTICLYGRPCIVTRCPFTFFSCLFRKNKEQRLICFLFRIYMQKLICRTRPRLMIYILLSHNL